MALNASKGLYDGCGTKGEQRRNAHEHTEVDDSDAWGILKAAFARLDHIHRSRPPTTNDDSDDPDGADPLTRIDLIRAVHRGCPLDLESFDCEENVKRTDATRGRVMTGTEAHQARFEYGINTKRPAFEHYGAVAISVAVPYDAAGNRAWADGIGTERGSYPACVELAPKHISGGLFNALDKTVTHPMLNGDSIVRFRVSRRPQPVSWRTPGDLVIHPVDGDPILKWIREFVAYAPPLRGRLVMYDEVTSDFGSTEADRLERLMKLECEKGEE